MAALKSLFPIRDTHPSKRVACATYTFLQSKYFVYDDRRYVIVGNGNILHAFFKLIRSHTKNRYIPFCIRSVKHFRFTLCRFELSAYGQRNLNKKLTLQQLLEIKEIFMRYFCLNIIFYIYDPLGDFEKVGDVIDKRITAEFLIMRSKKLKDKIFALPPPTSRTQKAENEGDAPVSFDQSLSQKLVKTLYCKTPQLNIYTVYDFECNHSIPEGLGLEQASNVRLYKNDDLLDCICCMQVVVEFLNYPFEHNKVKFENIINEQFNFFCSVNGWKRYKSRFPLALDSTPEIDEKIWVFVYDNKKQKEKPAPAKVRVEAALLEWLQEQQSIDPLISKICVRSTGFNNKKFDELYLVPHRPLHGVFRNLKQMWKGRLQSARTKLYHDTFTDVTISFSICDVCSFFVARLKHVAITLGLPTQKADAPLKLLHQHYSVNAKCLNKLYTEFPPQTAYYGISDEEYGNSQKRWEKARVDGSKFYDILQDTTFYCSLDVIVTAQALLAFKEKMVKPYLLQRLGLPDADIFKTSGTPALAWHIWATLTNSSGGAVENQIFSPTNQLFHTCVTSYFGGRVELRWQGLTTHGKNGPLKRVKADVIDVTSLYPTAFTGPSYSGRQIPMRENCRLRNNIIFESRKNTRIKPPHIRPFHALCRVRTPKNNFLKRNYGVAPVGGQIKSLITGKWSTKRRLWHNFDAIYITDNITAVARHNNGHRVTIEKFKYNVEHEKMSCSVRDAIKFILKIKEEGDEKQDAAAAAFGKNSPQFIAAKIQRELGKLMANGAYGYMNLKPQNETVKTATPEQITDLLLQAQDNKINIKQIKFYRNNDEKIKTDSAMSMKKLNCSPYALVWIKDDSEATNEHPVHIGASCTANSNYIMVDNILPKTDPLWRRRPLQFRPITYLYSDTDSNYTVNYMSKAFKEKYRLGQVGEYKMDKGRFKPTFKLEKDNIHELIPIAPKMISVQSDTINYIKAKGHAQSTREPGERAITHAHFVKMAKDMPLQFPYSIRGSMRKYFGANDEPGKINTTCIKRTIRKPEIYYDTHPLWPANGTLPYTHDMAQRVKLTCDPIAKYLSTVKQRCLLAHDENCWSQEECNETRRKRERPTELRDYVENGRKKRKTGDGKQKERRRGRGSAEKTSRSSGNSSPTVHRKRQKRIRHQASGNDNNAGANRGRKNISNGSGTKRKSIRPVKRR